MKKSYIHEIIFLINFLSMYSINFLLNYLRGMPLIPTGHLYHIAAESLEDSKFSTPLLLPFKLLALEGGVFRARSVRRFWQSLIRGGDNGSMTFLATCGVHISMEDE